MELALRTADGAVVRAGHARRRDGRAEARVAGCGGPALPRPRRGLPEVRGVALPSTRSGTRVRLAAVRGAARGRRDWLTAGRPVDEWSVWPRHRPTVGRWLHPTRGRGDHVVRPRTGTSFSVVAGRSGHHAADEAHRDELRDGAAEGAALARVPLPRRHDTTRDEPEAPSGPRVPQGAGRGVRRRVLLARVPLHAHLPKANRAWWTVKLASICARDRDTDEQLTPAGWLVVASGSTSRRSQQSTASPAHCTLGSQEDPPSRGVPVLCAGCSAVVRPRPLG